jgi:hypothetical protein
MRAREGKTFTPPRTAVGQPDMQGFWRGQGGGVENIEEHAGNGDVNAGPTWVVDTPDGKVPYQPWALEQRKENWEKYIDPNVSCLSVRRPADAVHTRRHHRSPRRRMRWS